MNEKDQNDNMEIEPVSQAGDWNMMGMDSSLDAGGPDDTFVSETGPKNHTAMILLAFCVLSMIGVYFLGISQKPKEATEEQKTVEAQVDTALTKLMDMAQEGKTKKLFNDTGKMVESFYDYPINQQVSVNDLQKNPFSFMSEVPVGEVVEDNSQSLAQMERAISRELQLLELQSVIQSPSGAKCLINGEVYSEGQSLNNVFIIDTIKANRVILLANENSYVLEM
ncbi:MAG: hypothetical protein JW860_05555 [Sedimentisphaerales bacterium]|nr:hypothetical protein [Sedimentisphaerales bacterium]